MYVLLSWQQLIQSGYSLIVEPFSPAVCRLLQSTFGREAFMSVHDTDALSPRLLLLLPILLKLVASRCTLHADIHSARVSKLL